MNFIHLKNHYMTQLTIEFGYSFTFNDSGGLESLFNDQKSFDMISDSSLLGDLILQISNKCSKKELFLKNDKVYLSCINDRRPGILVLINDADWEIMGMENYSLLENDRITFISTLHGG